MKSSKGIRWRFNHGAAVAALCCGLLMAGSAQAQWAVADVNHMIETIKEAEKQKERWDEQKKRWETQLADAKNVFKSQDIDMTMDFNERP